MPPSNSYVSSLIVISYIHPAIHYVCAKTGTDKHVDILGNYQHFGQVNTRHKVLDENKTVGKHWNVSLNYIPTIHGTSFCDLEAA